MIGCDGCARRREKLKRLQALAAERIRKVIDRVKGKANDNPS